MQSVQKYCFFNAKSAHLWRSCRRRSRLSSLLQWSDLHTAAPNKSTENWIPVVIDIHTNLSNAKKFQVEIKFEIGTTLMN